MPLLIEIFKMCMIRYIQI